MASTITLTSNKYGTADSNGEQRYLQLVCTQTKDIANNKSTIKWTLTSKGGSAKSYAVGPTTVYINGTKVYERARYGYTTEKFPNTKGSVSGTIDVKHDNEGEKSISVSLTTAIYVSATNTQSKTWPLDPIPRKAMLTYVPDFTDLDNPTIEYSNLAGNAVTSLEACIALNSTTIVVPYRSIDKAEQSYTFALTDAERDVLRNATTGTIRTMYFYVKTNIGGVNYYHSLPCTFTVKESDATVPSVTMNVTLDNSSLPSQFEGLYIQNKSRVDVTLSAQGKYNSSINVRCAIIDGQTYTLKNNEDKVKSNVIQSQGRLNLVGYARDSRNFTGIDSLSVDVIAYSKPLLIPLGTENAILCYRSDANGVRVGNSTSLWFKTKRTYSNVNGMNGCSLQYRFKLSTEKNYTGDWKDIIPATDTTNDEYNAPIPNEVFDTKKSYTVQVMVIDDVGECDIKTFDIPTADVALHLGRGGKNVTIGGYCDYAEDYTFTSEWKGIFNAGIQGTLGNCCVGENDILDYALKCGDGVTPIYTDDYTKNLPTNGEYRRSLGFIHRADGQVNIFLMNYSSGERAVRTCCDGTWEDWKYL